MRHSVFGRKLSRTKNERRRLFQGLARDLLHHGRIVTTLAKAKAVQPLVEQLVTKAKKGLDTHKRQALAVIADRKLVEALFEDAKTRFATRTSGFTRIIKLGARRGDATQEAMLSFVDERVETEVVAPKKAEKKGHTESSAEMVKTKPVKRAATGKRQSPKKEKKTK